MSVRLLIIFFYLVTSLSAWLWGYIYGKDIRDKRIPAKYGLVGVTIWTVAWVIILVIVKQSGWLGD